MRTNLCALIKHAPGVSQVQAGYYTHDQKQSELDKMLSSKTVIKTFFYEQNNADYKPLFVAVIIIIMASVCTVKCYHYNETVSSLIWGAEMYTYNIIYT